MPLDEVSIRRNGNHLQANQTLSRGIDEMLFFIEKDLLLYCHDQKEFHKGFLKLL